MKIMALKQLQAANPSLYDPIAIDTAALQAIGWSNPQQFMAPPQAQGAVPPQVQQIMAELQIKKQEADAKTMVAQAKVSETQGGGPQGAKAPDPEKMADLQIKQQDIQQKASDSMLDGINRKRDRESRERLAAIKLAEEMAKNPQAMGIVNSILQPGMVERLEANEAPLPGEQQ